MTPIQIHQTNQSTLSCNIILIIWWVDNHNFYISMLNHNIDYPNFFSNMVLKLKVLGTLMNK